MSEATTAKTLKSARKNFRPEEGKTLWMTAFEFAQVPHNLDPGNSNVAYTPNGEKWVWSIYCELWVRVAWQGFKGHYRKFSR